MRKRAAPRVGENAPVIGSRVWRLRNIELDERLLELRIGGTEVRVEPKPLSILMVLLRNADRVVPARELGTMVWGGRVVGEPVIAQSVARLRKALGPAHEDLVRTVHGWGYRLAETPEGFKPLPSSGGRGKEFKAGGDHPARRGWKLVEPMPVPEARAWLVEHQTSGMRRILLHLRRSAEVTGAAKEIGQYNGAVQSGKLDGLICHALDWNLDAGRGPNFIEYPANLLSLPNWIERQGGFAAVKLRDRLEIVARICDQLWGAHQHEICFGGLSPVCIVVGLRGPDEPMLYLPAAMHRIESLCSRLYCNRWHGEEAFYVAPELRRGEPASASADAFSIGVLLLQMAAGDWTVLPMPGWEELIADTTLRELVARTTHLKSSARPDRLRELAAEIRSCEPLP